MPFVRKFRALRRVWAVIRYVLVGIVLVGLLGWLWWWLASLGPRRVDDGGGIALVANDPALAKLAEEVAALATEYRNVAESGIITETAQAKLVSAVEKQRELIRLTTTPRFDQMERLRALEAEMDNGRVRRLNVRLDQLEKDAAEHLAAARVAAGLAMLEEALSLQREVNASNASPVLKNFRRETAFRQEIDNLAAAPMAAEAAAALEVAREAAGRAAWGAALAAYVQARDMQRRVNSTYPRTRYADIPALDRLEREIASLNAGGVATEIDAAERVGDAALEAGDFAGAVRLYAEAQARQVDINQQFQRSRFVSSARVEALEVKKQSALSAPRWAIVAGLEREITDLLRKRQVVGALTRINEAAGIVGELLQSYPRSLRADNALRIKLAYLELQRDQLRLLQDDFHAGVVPLPGVAERGLFRTEISQDLYTRVMNNNPSRNPGRRLPVDSVSWAEANEFCLRASWVLGTRVRLPTADEFRIAVGEAGEGGVWSAAAANGRSQEVGALDANTAGYHDLLGNLAEWLDAPPGLTGPAPVAGGSYLESEIALRRLPIIDTPRTERARHVGFRVVLVTTE